jgi:hypothetical protein
MWSNEVCVSLIQGHLGRNFGFLSLVVSSVPFYVCPSSTTGKLKKFEEFFECMKNLYNVIYLPSSWLPQRFMKMIANAPLKST